MHLTGTFVGQRTGRRVARELWNTRVTKGKIFTLHFVILAGTFMKEGAIAESGGVEKGDKAHHGAIFQGQIFPPVSCVARGGPYTHNSPGYHLCCARVYAAAVSFLCSVPSSCYAYGGKVIIRRGCVKNFVRFRYTKMLLPLLKR